MGSYLGYVDEEQKFYLPAPAPVWVKLILRRVIAIHLTLYVSENNAVYASGHLNTRIQDAKRN
jgi:hypothetical protein